MEKLEMLYEGKAKKVYATTEKDLLIVEYKDDATAFNGLKKGQILGKGVINNKMSNKLFQMLTASGVPNHFVKEIDDRQTIVKKVEIVPLEVIVRNVVAGSLAKKLGKQEGEKLDGTVLEICYKKDELGDPFINYSHVLALHLASREELKKIEELAFKANQLLQEYFLKLDLILVDIKFEFGRYKGEIILADEISPDTSRLWDAKTKEKLDKDRFRRDLGGVEEAYQEVYRRISQA